MMGRVGLRGWRSWGNARALGALRPPCAVAGVLLSVDLGSETTLDYPAVREDHVGSGGERGLSRLMPYTNGGDSVAGIDCRVA